MNGLINTYGFCDLLCKDMCKVKSNSRPCKHSQLVFELLFSYNNVYIVLTFIQKVVCFSNSAGQTLYFSDTCILQVLCVVLQLVETPKKYILSDVFTSWVLTLFNSEKHSPKWLFSVPSLTLCQCRPLISRLTFTLLGEACLLYPSGNYFCNCNIKLKSLGVTVSFIFM